MYSKTAIFYSSKQPFEVVGIEIPFLQDGQILVRNRYTTLCRSDLTTYLGKRQEKVPTILGHEIVGDIVAFGPGAPAVDNRGDRLTIGDRITWAIFASDPSDALSQEGMPQKANGLFKYGHERVTNESTLHGGLSEYIILRKHTPVVKVSRQMSDPCAAIINCAVATVMGAKRISGGVSHKRVLIAGAGMLGCIACAIFKTKGARSVYVLDKNMKRLNFAENFGIDGSIQSYLSEDQLIPESESGRFDLVFDFTGVPSTIEWIIRRLAIGGTAVLIGSTYPQRAVRLEAEYLVRNLLSITGLHNYNTEDLIMAVDFMEEYHDCFFFPEMICGDYTLDRVNEAFAFAIENNQFRVGINIKVK
ncbi:MAG: zinc-binding dehydrogenase, partial [Saprospiraceae bacterium]|nr:zinc-binding dehydrogenase [Saprospiraceae bacterium]